MDGVSISGGTDFSVDVVVRRKIIRWIDGEITGLLFFSVSDDGVLGQESGGDFFHIGGLVQGSIGIGEITMVIVFQKGLEKSIVCFCAH